MFVFFSFHFDTIMYLKENQFLLGHDLLLKCLTNLFSVVPKSFVIAKGIVIDCFTSVHFLCISIFLLIYAVKRHSNKALLFLIHHLVKVNKLEFLFCL